jgi:hypothetical protein
MAGCRIGSLTIIIQREQPQEAAKKADRLRAPEGPVYLAMRIYWPGQAALDGTWTPLPAVRVGCCCSGISAEAAVHRTDQPDHQ